MDCIICGNWFSSVIHDGACPTCSRAIKQLGLNMAPDRLQELAKAEKDGRLVVLPCKVGDLLYEIDLPEYGIITCKALEVHAYIGPDMHVQGAPMVSAESVSVEVIDGHGEGSGYTFEALDFGKTVFRTRKEAEAELKKRGGR